jgi:hypothetical protein
VDQQIQQLIGVQKQRAVEGQISYHPSNVVHRRNQKTAFKIVVPRRGIGINKGEAHETS